MSIVILAIMMSGISAVILCGGFAVMHKNTSTSKSTQLQTFTQDQRVKVSHDGSYLGSIFNGPSNPDNMCDIAYPATTPGKFMLSKVKTPNVYSIKANCDGDAKYTSFLADNAADLIQPKRTGSKYTWIVTCPSAATGCTIQASKSKKYLAPTATGVSLGASKAYWIVENDV